MANLKNNNDKVVGTYKKSMNLLQTEIADLKKKNKGLASSAKNSDRSKKELANLKGKLAKADKALKDANRKYSASVKSLQADLAKSKKATANDAKWKKDIADLKKEKQDLVSLAKELSLIHI